MKRTCFLFLTLMLLFVPSIALAYDAVGVAGSIYPCLQDMAKSYETNGRKAPSLVCGTSGKLAAQIEAGAPFGLYLSANLRWAQKLHQEGLIEEVIVMATSPVALWWPGEDAPDSEVLERKDIRVAIADPGSAPFGRAAKTYLADRGLYDRLLAEKRLIISGTVLQAALVARSGGADAAIVSLSVARKANSGSSCLLSVEPLKNAGAIVGKYGTPDLRTFWKFIRSEKARPIWKKWGFEPL